MIVPRTPIVVGGSRDEIDGKSVGMEPHRVSSLAANRVWWWFAGLMLAVAVAMRVAALRTQFWLDEIWSLGIALNLNSPVEILTRVHLDNNHHLNTLWLYLCGWQRDWTIYRLHSLAAGIVTVLLAAQFCRRWGARAACFAVLLTGTSYLLVLYAAEARGYALAGCFGLAAFLALERHLQSPRWIPLLVWWSCTWLGALSHLTVVHVYAAAMVWSLIELARQRRGAWYVVQRLAICHLVPIVGLAALYVVDIREMQIGGGPIFSSIDILRDASAVALGVTEPGAWSWLAALITATAGVAGLVLLFRENAALATFFAMAIVISPALALILSPPKVIFVRYFYVNILFFLLLLAYLLNRLCTATRVGVLAAGGVLAAITVGNALQFATVLQDGRGDYQGALRYMQSHTRGPIVHIGSDHDFRAEQVIKFYAERLNGEPPLQYHPRHAWPAGGPEWIIISDGQITDLPKVMTSPEGTRYELQYLAPAAPLAGIGWAVYHGKLPAPSHQLLNSD